MRINFITNIPLGEISGGFSGMNRAAYDSLCRLGEVNYVGPVNPPVNKFRKLVSKVRRAAGMKGEYFFFSPGRLDQIARDVKSRMDPKADVDFFHGFTSWIKVSSGRPYAAWSDCTFRQYMDIYHQRSHFQPSGLKAVEDTESEWLGRAERIIFRSHWARELTSEQYGLSESKIGVSRNFGMVAPPEEDRYSDGRAFVMITTNFQQKGGEVVLRAFEQSSAAEKGWELVIVGADPGPAAKQQRGVSYLGWLDKNVAHDRGVLEEVLGKARALVHPTKADTNPMVILEAGYFGCPSISSRRFAIPELIVDGKTGVLLDDSESPEALAAAMRRMMNDDSYLPMRAATRRHCITNYSETAFRERMDRELRQAFAY